MCGGGEKQTDVRQDTPRSVRNETETRRARRETSGARCTRRTE